MASQRQPDPLASKNPLSRTATISEASPFSASPHVQLRHEQIAATSAPPTKEGSDPAAVDSSMAENANELYNGYMHLSNWMASNDDFFVVRRFQSLNAHTILYMQDRLTRIEERLCQLQETPPESGGAGQGNNDSFTWDVANCPERDRLMRQLTGLLNHYNQYLDTYTRIRERPVAENYQLVSVEEKLKTGIICEEETGYAQHKNDLISITPRRYSFLEHVYRSLPTLRGCLNRRIPVCYVEPRSKQRRGEMYPSAHRSGYAALFLDGFIIGVGLCLLLAPLWITYALRSTVTAYIVISAFLFYFSTILWLTTSNRPIEIVAATAAYAAVLVALTESEHIAYGESPT